MQLELILICEWEYTLGMSFVVLLGFRNGSMMYGHMMLPWLITWKLEEFLGKIGLYIDFNAFFL